MLQIVHGDIFESGAQALVNPVNCVGVMGAGLAKEFKKRFPDNYEFYRRCCEIDGMSLGRSVVYKMKYKQTDAQVGERVQLNEGPDEYGMVTNYQFV